MIDINTFYTNLNGGEVIDCWKDLAFPLIVVPASANSASFSIMWEGQSFPLSVATTEFPKDIPPVVQSKIFLLISPKSDPIISGFPFGLFDSLLLSKGNNSVNVSKSANERSSNVLSMVMLLVLLLAVLYPVEVMFVWLTFSLLFPILLPIVGVGYALFSNFNAWLAMVVSMCGVRILD